MKIALPFEQFFDDQGRPLVAGRVTVYKHDSDIPADLFTLEGDIYSAAQNPFRTDNDGRIPTVWFNAAVVDVKVERLLDDHVNFELVDTFQAGFEYPAASNSTLVYGMTELKSTDPAVGIVEVVGYNSGNDCPPRFYIWDSHCEDSPDGGVVVESTRGDEGRWILLYDDELLPCQFYGIVPGEEEANISAFLNYADNIGTYKIRTPMMPRFLGGTYVSDTVFQTNKSIYFDRGAKFPNAQFVCRSAVIPENSDYVADFSFSDNNAIAHSSWFKTLTRFYNCGADKLFIDKTNYFTNSVINSAVDLQGKNLIGTTRIQATYQNNGYVQINDSTECGRLFSTTEDYVRIVGQGHGDDVFSVGGSWGPGLIADGYHVQYDNVPKLETFENTSRWVSVMLERRGRLSSTAWGEYTLDLQGRVADSAYLNSTSFTTVRNGRFTGTVTCVGSIILFDNVTASVSVDSDVSGGLALSATNSHLSIQAYHPGLASITTTDSYISVAGPNGIDPCDTAISMYGGVFTGIVKMSTDNCNAYKANKSVAFQKVSISGGYSWRLNNIVMVDCASDCKIDLYPAADTSGINTVYLYNCLMQDNNFTGNFRLWITYYWDASHSHNEVRGTSVKFNQMVIVGNKFNTVDQHGIKMTNWHVGALTYYMYANYADNNMGTWRYQGNTGNCPLTCPGLMDNSLNWETVRTDSVTHFQSRRSGTAYYLFTPYVYLRETTDYDAPSVFLNPADPSQQVLANIHGDDWKDSWCYADTWYANGIASTAQLEDEDYNNRFFQYIWLTRREEDVPNWHHTGSGHAWTTFILPSTHA